VKLGSFQKTYRPNYFSRGGLFFLTLSAFWAFGLLGFWAFGLVERGVYGLMD
jgi:hypothetical protein